MQRKINFFPVSFFVVFIFADDAGVPSKSHTLGKYQSELNKLLKSRLSKQDSKAFSTANKRFSDNIETYDDLVDAFNRGDPFTRIAQTFGKNKDSLRQLIEFYEKKTGESITGVISGRELSAAKKSNFFLSARDWFDFFVTPEQQARGVTFIGKGQQKSREIVSDPLKQLAERLRDLDFISR